MLFGVRASLMLKITLPRIVRAGKKPQGIEPPKAARHCRLNSLKLAKFTPAKPRGTAVCHPKCRGRNFYWLMFIINFHL